MADVVTDAVGIHASVGDTVVFYPRQRGAQKMLTGKVERITQKGVIIGVDGKLTHLGSFKTFEEACKARADAEMRIYGFVKE